MTKLNYLTKLSASGLKSGDFDHALDRVVVFQGNSFSGKTSRLEAIRLGLIGYVPELGKTSSSTMQLARNGCIRVALEDNAGRTVNRAFGKTKAADTSSMPEMPPVLMDPSVYFSLSDKKKIEYVFGMFQMGESDDFSGPAVVAAVKNIRLETNTAESETIIQGIAREIDASDTERHESGTPLQEWLEATIANLKERLKAIKATCDRMTKTVAGLTQISASEQPARNFTADIQAKRKELAEVHRTIGSLEQSLRHHANLDEKVRRLKAATSKAPGVLPEVGPRINVLEGRINELTSANPLDQELSTTTERLTSQCAALQTEIDAYQSATTERMESLSVARVKVQTFEQQLSDLDAADKQAAEKYAALLKHPSCPECGTAIKSIRDLLQRKAAEEKARRSIERTRLVEQIEAHRQLANTAAEQLRLSRGRDADHDAKRREISRLQQEITKGGHQRQQIAQDTQREVSSVRRQILDLEATLAQAKARNAERDALVGQLNAASEELRRLDPQSLSAQKLTAEVQRDQITQEVMRIEEQQRSWQRRKDDEQRNAQALAEHARSQAELEVTKAAITTLEEIQARMVAAAFDRILKTVNAVTGRIIPEPIEYREGELGRWHGATWVRHSTFSGAEKALTYAGLSLALAETAPVKIVLMDELGIMDSGTLKTVLHRMTELVGQGLIGQFVGCSAVGIDCPGVKVISL
jgi:DNA repair exonuclease SbcCD ATPase subunit